MSNKDALTLFNVQKTRVTTDPSALGAPLAMFVLGAALAGGASLLGRLRRGLFWSIAYLTGDATHFGGHIVSSRYAGSPPDQIYIGAPMPQSVYENNDVSPQVHKLRSIGGPVGSILSLLVAFVLRVFTAPNTAAREFLNAQCWVHGFLGFGSLMPIPFIDGGTILKWSLVEQGQTPEQADESVKQANLALGGLFGLVGLLGALLKRWGLAAVCGLVATQLIAIGLGKLNIK